MSSQSLLRFQLRRYRWRIAALVFLIIATAVFLAAAWFFAGLVAQPSWARPDPVKHGQSLEAFAARYQANTFSVKTADGLVLRGYHLPTAEKNRKAVVLLHGYGGNLLEYETQLKPWQELGYDIFLYDQRGSGASDGNFLSAGVLESRDLVLVLQAIRDHMPKDAKVGIYGRSGGGASATLFAGHGGVADFLVVDCAFSNFPRVLRFRLDHDYPFIPSVLRQPDVPPFSVALGFRVRGLI